MLALQSHLAARDPAVGQWWGRGITFLLFGFVASKAKPLEVGGASFL